MTTISPGCLLILGSSGSAYRTSPNCSLCKGNLSTNTHTRSTALFLTLPRWASKTNLDFTEARDSEWQWHQLGHTQVCMSLQTDNHASTPPLSLLQARYSSCRPTNSVRALKEISNWSKIFQTKRANGTQHGKNCITCLCASRNGNQPTGYNIITNSHVTLPLSKCHMLYCHNLQ